MEEKLKASLIAHRTYGLHDKLIILARIFVGKLNVSFTYPHTTNIHATCPCVHIHIKY